MMNKRAFTVPSWMLGVLLVIIILIIIIAYLVGPYGSGLQNFVQTNIVKPIQP